MKSNLFSKKSIVKIVSLMAVLSLLMVAVTPAFAKPLSVSTDPTSGVTGGASDSKSEAMFHHALTVYNSSIKTRIFENNTLDASLAYIHTRENGAAGGKGRGYGSFSPNQFAALYGSFAQVNNMMNLIKSMMISHPGFDKYGKVTNSALAADVAKEIDSYAKSLQYYTIKANSLYSALQHTR